MEIVLNWLRTVGNAFFDWVEITLNWIERVLNKIERWERILDWLDIWLLLVVIIAVVGVWLISFFRVRNKSLNWKKDISYVLKDLSKIAPKYWRIALLLVSLSVCMDVIPYDQLWWVVFFVMYILFYILLYPVLLFETVRIYISPAGDLVAGKELSLSHYFRLMIIDGLLSIVGLFLALFFLVPGIWWGTKSSLAYTVAYKEEKNVFQCLQKSHQILNQFFWQAVSYLFPIMILVYLPGEMLILLAGHLPLFISESVTLAVSAIISLIANTATLAASLIYVGLATKLYLLRHE